MRRITLFDYGAGNLHSLGKALAGTGREVRVETDPLAALETDVLVLPGVGAFAPAAARLAAARVRCAMPSSADCRRSASASACSCCSTRARRGRATASGSFPAP
jgi:imidazoleglycerol phosphate synthase glutamine amidotransferase subunit HisH